MGGPALGTRVAAAAAIVAVTALAWVATGEITRRVQARRLPPLADLTATPEAAQVAIREADVAARRDPGAASVGALGQAYHAAQLAAPAMAAYAVAEALAPTDWRWPYLQALILEERGETTARARLEQVTRLAPEAGHAWYRLGETEFKRGDLDAALAAYQRAAQAPAAPAFLPPGVSGRQTFPLSAYAGLGLARVAVERGDAAGARARLSTIIASYPAFGGARAFQRQVDRAAVDSGASGGTYVPPADPVVDALVASSRHSDVLLKYAGLATRAGDDAWREFLVRRAVSFNGDDLNVLMEMAAMLQATGRPAEALTYLTRHETLAPGDHHSLVEQGRVLGDLGRLAEAEGVLRRATAVRDAAAEYNLGTVIDRQNRWDEARVHYERALAIDPFHARAMNNLAVGLDRRGQTSTALGWFERAIGISPEAAEFHVNYGSALIQARRFDDAVGALTTALALEPREANGHNNLGIARASLGDLAGARAEFARALEIDPRHVNARRNFERVTSFGAGAAARR